MFIFFLSVLEGFCAEGDKIFLTRFDEGGIVKSTCSLVPLYLGEWEASTTTHCQEIEWNVDHTDIAHYFVSSLKDKAEYVLSGMQDCKKQQISMAIPATILCSVGKRYDMEANGGCGKKLRTFSCSRFDYYFTSRWNLFNTVAQPP